MALVLPSRFKSDIEGKQTAMIPRVVIGEEHKTYISTHKLNFEGNYYKPILLNVPSMKESIDIETRNFKISNVTLNISNFEIDGEIFSDSLQEHPLINKRVEIYFDTQSSSSSEDSLLAFKGFVRRISHTSSTVNLQLEDLTQSTLHKTLPIQKTSMSKSLPNKYQGVPIPISYGYLKNAPAVLDSGGVIKADYDETVSLITTDSDSYQPDVIWGDYNQFNEENSYSPFKLVIDDNIIHIPKKTIKEIENEETLEKSPLDYVQFYDGEGVDEILEQEGTVKILPFPQRGSSAVPMKVLQGICQSKPSNISCTYRSSASLANMDNIELGGGVMNDGEDGWDNPERFTLNTINHLTDGSYTFDTLENLNGYEPESSFIFPFHYFAEGGDYANSGEYNYNCDGNVSQGLIRVSADSQPNFEHLSLWKNTEFSINGTIVNFKDEIRLTAIYSRGMSEDNAKAVQHSFTTLPSDVNTYSSRTNIFYLNGTNIKSDGSEGVFHQDFRGVFEFTYDGAIDDYNYKGNPSLGQGLIRIENLESNRPFYGGFIRILDSTYDYGQVSMTFGSYVAAGYNSTTFNAKLTGSWSEIDLLQLVDVQYKTDLDFLLDVEGRASSAESAGGNPVMRNPIEIIKDIFVSELGLRDIGVDSSGNPLEDVDIDEEHDNLKFDFSINKKIESKKIIEEIAKSTLCYPYFSNQGKLTFPTLKQSYSYEDYNTAEIIKDSDVVDFSFNKTKLEKMYSMIDFNYNYDYVSESYESNLFEGLHTTDLDLDYNGHLDIDSNVLEFECPYIRDADTANKVWNNLFRFYRHQHLTFKIKLPLKYIAIDVGDTIRFDKLLDGRKAFGIDYTKLVQLVKNQPIQQGGVAYPLFIVTAVNKNLDSIDIEGFQIHTLGEIGSGFNDLWEQEEVDSEDFEGETPLFQEQPISLTKLINKQKFSIFSESGFIRYDDLLHWFQPQAFGLNSFNELIPSSWDSFNGAEIRDYIALFFDIKFYRQQEDQHWIHRFTLKNQGNHQAENFDLQWESEVLYPNENLAPDAFQQGITLQDNHGGYIQNINTEPSFSQAFEVLHSVSIGGGLIKAGELSLLGFELTNSEGIDFNSLYNIRLSSEQEFEVGDVSRDFSLSILDIVAIINHIMTSNNQIPDEYEYLGDFNQDGYISILDIVQLVNHIMEE